MVACPSEHQTERSTCNRPANLRWPALCLALQGLTAYYYAILAKLLSPRSFPPSAHHPIDFCAPWELFTHAFNLLPVLLGAASRLGHAHRASTRQWKGTCPYADLHLDACSPSVLTRRALEMADALAHMQLP